MPIRPVDLHPLTCPSGGPLRPAQLGDLLQLLIGLGDEEFVLGIFLLVERRVLWLMDDAA